MGEDGPRRNGHSTYLANRLLDRRVTLLHIRKHYAGECIVALQKKCFMLFKKRAMGLHDGAFGSKKAPSGFCRTSRSFVGSCQRKRILTRRRGLGRRRHCCKVREHKRTYQKMVSSLRQCRPILQPPGKRMLPAVVELTEPGAEAKGFSIPFSTNLFSGQAK